MATIFDLLDTLNNNNNNLYSSPITACKRKQQQPHYPIKQTISNKQQKHHQQHHHQHQQQQQQQHNPIKQTISNPNNQQQKQQQQELMIINIVPDMEVTMYDDKLVIDVELAGVSKDNIEIDIKDSILTIQGEKKKRENKDTTSLVNTSINKNDSDEPCIEEFEDGEYKVISKSNETTTTSSSSSNNRNNNNNVKKYISERSFGYFKRFIDLSKIIYQLDLTQITTKFENGLLTIQINKKSNHKSNTFKIEIN